MDAIVQLIRNGLCCVKDLKLFGSTFLYDPSLVALYYKAPPPMDQTTPLEFFISICQLYAFVSVTLAGLRLISDSWSKFRWLNRLVKLRSAGKNATSTADKIVDESLGNERVAARRNVITGWCLLAIGIPFFWLFANSWHVTETDWIGGMQGLIYALASMEIALLPLLWWMMADAQALVTKSVRMVTVAGSLKKSGVKLDDLDAQMYLWIVPEGWTPFWTSSTSSLQSQDNVAMQKMLNSEVEKVNGTLEELKKSSDLKDTLNGAAMRLEEDAPTVRMEGYREYFYLLANFIAFYGYLLGIVAYYHHEEEAQPTYVRHLKLGMTNEDADWHGNFAGDFMWTLEPVVILSSPTLLSWMKPQTKKVKKD